MSVHNSIGDPNSLQQRKETPSNDLHPIFSQDPSQWVKLLHQKVCVYSDDGNKHEGWVYTIDPVSQSIVLLQHNNVDDNDNNSEQILTINMNIIVGSSIDRIEQLSLELSKNSNVKYLCNRLFRPKSSVGLGQEELLKRREKLKCWLLKHRLPVQIGGSDGQSLVVADVLVIQSPFLEDNCLSTNEIILSKIRGLIKNMPDDQDTW